MEIFNSNQPVPVILKSDVCGYGVVRGLAKIGLQSIVLDSQRTEAWCSRYTKAIQTPDPQLEESEYVKAIKEVGRRLKVKGILWACADSTLYVVQKYRDELELYFKIPMAPNNVLHTCHDKSLSYNAALSAGVAVPRTHQFATVREIDDFMRKLPFPSILKSSKPLTLNAKVYRVPNTSHMMCLIGQLIKQGYGDVPVLVQEDVPGPPTNLYTFASYCNKQSKILCYSTAHKIRQGPDPQAGVATCIHVLPCPELVRISMQFLQFVKFYGVSNIEFKRDAVTGEFKFIEINPRPGISIWSAASSGVNLVAAAYCDAIGQIYSGPKSSKVELKWIDESTDPILSLNGYKQRGYAYSHLSVRNWLQSIKGRKAFAFFSFSDPLPFVVMIIFYCYNLFRSLLYILLSPRGVTLVKSVIGRFI